MEEFTGEVFAPSARADRRVKGGLYLRDVLLVGLEQDSLRRPRDQ
ncbi:hypothetical protein [Streptomyces sp. NPDC026673]